MTRPRTLTVEPYPDPAVDRNLSARVASAEANLKSQELRVRLELLSKEQEGRIQELSLPLPVRPAGRTASFVRACGIDVRVGAEIKPGDLVGKIILVRFGSETEDLKSEVVSFGQSTKEICDDSTTVKSGTATAATSVDA